ncbi:hypothetical protein DH2020_029044 [Rehmannia glutinosa]|uniref:Uncharacterized protein n=1 Tax=Rehmannia glutinosa TaxID=99300 RepID=A0ABR0VPN7_REHGL
MAAATLTCNHFPQLRLQFGSSKDTSHFIPRSFRIYEKPRRSSSPRMTINRNSGAQIGNSSENPRSGRYRNGKMYRRLDSCLVIPPAKGRKPKGLIKFLGGAFIGAVPEVTYRVELFTFELLANEGYLIISVPYNVTFDHEKVTREIYKRFHTCLDSILATGLPENGISAAEIADLPYYSVGHSNGALVQVLTGVISANAIISYNNRPASEAVPYFEQGLRKGHSEYALCPQIDFGGFASITSDLKCMYSILQLGPLVSQMMPAIETSPLYSMAQSVSVHQVKEYLPCKLHRHSLDIEILFDYEVQELVDGWKTLIDVAERVVPDYDPEATVSLTKFVDQLPSVFNQVKFDFDAIDETDLLEKTLKPRVESFGGRLEKVVLRGNHITPCIQEPRWQVGPAYTPADAIAQGIKAISVNDIKVLSRTISKWFGSLDS